MEVSYCAGRGWGVEGEGSRCGCEGLAGRFRVLSFEILDLPASVALVVNRFK